MDWLQARQGEIERRLAEQHLHDGALVLYDVSSTYFEGRCCPLARLGYSREGRRDKLQIVFGLLCDREGCPIAVEAFEGNTADPKTLGAQIEKLRTRFGLRRASACVTLRAWLVDRFSHSHYVLAVLNIASGRYWSSYLRKQVSRIYAGFLDASFRWHDVRSWFSIRKRLNETPS